MSDTNQGLGLAVMGEGAGAHYVGTVNQTIQGSFTVKNIGTIAANNTIEATQSNGPLGSLRVTTEVEQFLLYPQETIIVYFSVTILLNITDLMSIDWLVSGIGEERTEEGSSIVSVAVVSRSYFQILGYSGILTIEVKDQNQDDYNNLIVQIKRDYLVYANKSTRNGQAEFLLSVPANYSLSIYRDSVEVYFYEFEMTGDRRIQILVKRPHVEVVAEFPVSIFVVGFIVGYIFHVIKTRIGLYRKRLKKTEEEKELDELWDWVTEDV